MSLSSLNFSAAANAGRVVEVLHPVERTPLKAIDGTPVTFSLLGQDSEAIRSVQRRTQDERRDKQRRGIKLKAADDERAEVEVLVAGITGWTGVPRSWIDVNAPTDETLVEFNKANAEALISNPGMKWLRDWIDTEISERAGFLKT